MKKKINPDWIIKTNFSVRNALSQLERSGLGALLLVGESGSFERTVTDGDLRRLLLEGYELDATLTALPKISSITILNDYTRQNALSLMNKAKVNHLPVVDHRGCLVDFIDRKSLDEQILLSIPHLGDCERDFVNEAFKTNWIAPLGPNVDAFEKEVAAFIGVGHAAAVSSGTAAIHLALVVLGVTRGDVVFCSAFTFVATANPILYQGAEPIFIDSEPSTWNMSPIALERALADAKANNKLPKAVLVVNLYGQNADMISILQICDSYGVPVIEDAAESMGAKYNEKYSGSFGKLGIFSFNGNKIITTSGGGMLVSDDEELIKKARFLSTQARDPFPYYQHHTIGYNYRMSNILAGVGRGQLRVLEDRVCSRRNVFERYRNGLSDLNSIQWMPEAKGHFSNRWLSTGIIRDDKTNATAKGLINFLAEELIESRHVWKPMQLQPLFAGAKYYQHTEKVSVSESLYKTGFCLPSSSNMSVANQERVIDSIRKYFELS